MKDKGVPAFPYPDTGDKGMSLRDYFAGQALVGLMSKETVSIDPYLGADEAYLAYSIADAMLKIREED